METSYQYYKRMGVKEVPLDKLPKNYGWITGCGGDGWYWNFFTPVELDSSNCPVDKMVMCKIKKL